MKPLEALGVLIIEDGDEYLHALSRYVAGPRYLQAHSGQEALDILSTEPVDVVYLDMRFDRTPTAALLGDRAEAARKHGGERGALRHLAEHQGLYILHALHEGLPAPPPVVLAHDFARQPERFERLSARYPGLSWVGDGADADAIRSRLLAAATR